MVLEGRSLRNDIQLDGITEAKGEKGEDCKKKILEILKDNLEIEDVTIERAHKVKPYQSNKNSKGKATPRTIECKFG